MTKRFKFNGRNNCIEYDGKSILLDSYGEDIEELLNKLHEENKKLKQVNEMLQMDSAMTERNLIEENEQLRKDLIDHSALISMLEDYQALKIEETLWNLTGAKSEEEFNELYKPYLEKAKRCWR